MDQMLLELTPGPTIAIDGAIVTARDAVLRAAADLLAVPDHAMERPWTWRGEEADVRYGFYDALERLEAAEAIARRALEHDPPRTAPAARLIAPATVARWDLHGLLLGLDDADWDAEPGGGEWTVRQTLGHTISGQRTYGWFTGWWLGQAGRDPFPTAVPDELADRVPDEHGPEMAGTPSQVRARLDAILDDCTARLGSLGDDDLAQRARWSGIEVTVGFRIARWSSHIVEHAIQVEKTLAMLGRTPTETQRVVRAILGAYGRLESTVFGRSPAALDARDDLGRTVREAFAPVEALAGSAATVRAAATAWSRDPLDAATADELA